MVQLKHSEMRVFDDAFDIHGGYVLDFSDRTFLFDLYQQIVSPLVSKTTVRRKMRKASK